MIRSVKNKFCATGDGAEFPDRQFVFVDGIMVQNVVLFKQKGVIDKIVIHRKIADGNVGIRYDRLQIDGLPVPWTGIYALF